MRQPRLIPLYLLLLFPLVTANRPVYAGEQPQNLTREDLLKAIEKMPPGSTFQFGQVVEGANAQGVSGTATGDKASLEGQNMTPPTVTLPGATGQGGGGSMGGQASILNRPSIVRIICGVLSVACLIGAGLAVWRQWRLPVLPVKLVLGAIGFGVCAWFPNIAVAVLAGYILIEIADSLVGGQLATRAKEALRAVVAGVADTTAEVQESVTRSIKAHADAADKRTIAAVKFKDGLK